MNNKKTLGSIIKELRIKQRYSQRALAKEVGISPATMSLIEKDAINTNVNTLNKIAKTLGTTIEDIMKQAEAEDMDKKEYIGQVIKNLRKSKKISQRQLSIITGLSNTAISNIEKGIADVKVANLSKIAKALDTTIEDIIKQAEAEDMDKKEEQKQEELPVAEIEEFLAGQKMLMFKGKPVTEDDLRSVYAFLQLLEKKYSDKE
jgi:transcriptional regulator with XRE-family HTH domain